MWERLERREVDRLRPSHIVNPNDQRVHVGKRFLASKDKRGQGEADNRENEDDDLEIGIHHERVSILFEIPLCCACDLGCWLRRSRHKSSSFSRIP